MTKEGTLMVGLVGDNPTSILVVARALKPTRVLLVCSKKTAPAGGALKEQLGELPVDSLELDTPDSLLRIQQQVNEWLSANTGLDSILFDCTGGTKPMLLGVWQELHRRFSDKIRTVYLTPAGHLCDMSDGHKIENDVTLTAEEFLAWHRAKKQKSEWEGSLKDTPREYLDRARVGHLLMEVFKNNQTPQINPGGWCDERVLSWPSKLPAGLQRKEKRIYGSGKYFSQNGWLEEFCLAVAYRVAHHAPEVMAYLNMHVLGQGEGGQGQDESDLVLVRGPRLVVIEAKAKKHAEGAGNPIQLRSQKTSRFFGSMTRMIFVHPAWGLAPPAALDGMISRNVTLIGADEQRLESAIKEALGL
jgi:hypothetical protein